MIKYTGKVISIGPLVTEFIEAGILVFFGANAPEELLDFSIVHDGTQLVEPVTPGDTVIIDGNHFRVLAVGEVVNSNLGNLGHLILKFNGKDSAQLPGDVNVEEKPVPSIEVGSVFSIESTQ